MTDFWIEIRISETLDCRWSYWFEGLEVLPAEDSPPGGTLLRGCLPDQPALFGVLNQLRNLNLTLVEVRRVSPPD
jgi:hypothetical protein